MVKSKGLYLLVAMLFAAVLAGCSSGNCRKNQMKDTPEFYDKAVEKVEGTQAVQSAEKAKKEAKENAIKAVAKVTDRVRVFKYDGSLQCNQGKPIALAEMQKELKGIQVYSAENRRDSLMRIQVCGAPTGQANVYEIDRRDLDQAKKLGFQIWTFD